MQSSADQPEVNCQATLLGSQSDRHAFKDICWDGRRLAFARNNVVFKRWCSCSFHTVNLLSFRANTKPCCRKMFALMCSWVTRNSSMFWITSNRIWFLCVNGETRLHGILLVINMIRYENGVVVHVKGLHKHLIFKIVQTKSLVPSILWTLLLSPRRDPLAFCIVVVDSTALN